MSLLEKVANMLGFGKSKPKAADYIAPDLSKALQRNEMASARARAALEDVLARNDRLHGSARQ